MFVPQLFFGRVRLVVRSSRNLLCSIWEIDRARFLQVAVLMVARCIVEGYGLLLLLPLLDSMTREQGYEPRHLPSPVTHLLALCGCEHNRWALLILFTLLIGFRSLVGYMTQVTIGILYANVLSRQREAYYKALGNARWDYIVTRDSSKYLQALSSQTEAVSYAVQSFASVANGILSLLAGIGIALLMSFKLTVLVLAIALIVALPLSLFDVYHYRLSKKTLQIMTAYYAKLNKHLGNLKFFKLRAENEQEASFLQACNSYSSLHCERIRVTARANLFHETGAAMILGTIVFLGQGSPIDSTAVVLVIIFARLVPRVNDVQSSIRGLLSIIPQFEDLARELSGLHLHGEGVSRANLNAPKFVKSLRFVGVSYHYPSRKNHKALSRVTWEIPAGTSLGVIGLSGAGKTTFADLAAGLLAPTEGAILVDDVPLRGDRSAAWRQSVSYVLQDDPLINDTIAANIRLGRADASDSDIWKILKVVGLESLVHALPNGLVTSVGERGQNLSKGQRQRICLARALIAQPTLLILDECTSGLNPVDEIELGNLFAQISKMTTTIMISHRPATLTWVDLLIVLREGEIVESGSPAKLRRDTHCLLRRMQDVQSPSETLY